MDLGLLTRLFGNAQQWQGPCVIVLDAESSVQTAGTDAIAGGGLKVFAPRTASGRVVADGALLLKDNSALVILQQQRLRGPTGDEQIKQTLVLADPARVVAVEFGDNSPQILENLGLGIPNLKPGSSGNSGILQRPKSASAPLPPTS